MSRIGQVLRLCPPGSGSRTEDVSGACQECSVCHGEGWIWSEGRDGDSEKRRCAACEGCGYLLPVVRIEWRPCGRAGKAADLGRGAECGRGGESAAPGKKGVAEVQPSMADERGEMSEGKVSGEDEALSE